VRPFLRPATRGSVWRRAYRYRFCYLALAPSFAFLLGFKYYPMLAAIYYSFTDWDGLSAQFIGVQNYVEMIGDPVFQQAVHNMGFLAIFRLVVHLVMPLLAAELIFNLRNSRAGYFWRLLFLVPLVVPGIVVLLIWGFIYTPQLGLLNQLLRGIGAGALAQSWLGDPGIALPALAFVGFPWVGGIALLIFLAGLQNIPEEAIEAARLDGASGLRRVWALDVPLIVGQIKVMRRADLDRERPRLWRRADPDQWRPRLCHDGAGDVHVSKRLQLRANGVLLRDRRLSLRPHPGGHLGQPALHPLPAGPGAGADDVNRQAL